MNYTGRYTRTDLILSFIVLVILSPWVASADGFSATLKSEIEASLQTDSVNRFTTIATEDKIPSIEFTSVPRYGEWPGILHGTVTNIAPAEYEVACYIQVNGVWWPKPTFQDHTVPINEDIDGNLIWECNTTTGGVDNQATQIVAVVVPKDSNPPNSPETLIASGFPYNEVIRHPNPPLFGLNYGPYRAGQMPGGTDPTPAQIAEDMKLLAQKVPVIRIYGSQGIGANIVAEAGLHDTQVVLGAWISGDPENNQREVETAIALTIANPDVVIAVIVGSEVLLRGDLTEEELIPYIQQVKDGVSVPVGYADNDQQWLISTNLVNAVDWVGLQIYGFWNCQSVSDSPQFARDRWNAVQTAPGFESKRILLLETGWPNAGYNPACPAQTTGSESDQEQFISDMITMAKADSIDLFLFEFVDEPWKCTVEPVVGCHWGLLREARMPWAAWDVLPDLWPIHPVLPVNDRFMDDSTPTFHWSKVIKATHYRIQIDNDSDFSSPIINVNTDKTEYTAPKLADNVYYWRVRAQWGNWSTVWTFTVDKFMYITPPERNYFTSLPIVLTWNRVTGADCYNFQVDNNPNFLSLEYEELCIPADTLYASIASLANGTYSWRVRAVYANDRTSNWSMKDSFVLNVP